MEQLCKILPAGHLGSVLPAKLVLVGGWRCWVTTDGVHSNCKLGTRCKKPLHRSRAVPADADATGGESCLHTCLGARQITKLNPISPCAEGVNVF